MNAQSRIKFAGLIAVAGSALLGVSGAQAQAVKYVAHCHTIGINPQEPLGDRPGHALSLSTYTCVVEGGPFDGAVFTGESIYEWDNGKAVGISGDGVLRKPGAMGAYRLTDFKNELTMADGKVTGFAASGHGVYAVATGSAASAKGRSFSYTAHPTGPGQFLIETTLE